MSPHWEATAMEMMMTIKTGPLRAHRSRGLAGERITCTGIEPGRIRHPGARGVGGEEGQMVVRPLARLAQFWCGQTDLAPLALFRIAYGAMLFGWFWQLLPSMTPFFTDEGMLPVRCC